MIQIRVHTNKPIRCGLSLTTEIVDIFFHHSNGKFTGTLYFTFHLMQEKGTQMYHSTNVCECELTLARAFAPGSAILFPVRLSEMSLVFGFL